MPGSVLGPKGSPAPDHRPGAAISDFDFWNNIFQGAPERVIRLFFFKQKDTSFLCVICVWSLKGIQMNNLASLELSSLTACKGTPLLNNPESAFYQAPMRKAREAQRTVTCRPTTGRRAVAFKYWPNAEYALGTRLGAFTCVNFIQFSQSTCGIDLLLNPILYRKGSRGSAWLRKSPKMVAPSREGREHSSPDSLASTPCLRWDSLSGYSSLRRRAISWWLEETLLYLEAKGGVNWVLGLVFCKPLGSVGGHCQLPFLGLLHMEHARGSLFNTAICALGF